jgi:hypothetical protein
MRCLKLPDAIGELVVVGGVGCAGRISSHRLAAIDCAARLAAPAQARSEISSEHFLTRLAAISTLQDLFVKSNQLTVSAGGRSRASSRCGACIACFNQIAVAPAQLCCLTSLQNCSFSNNALSVRSADASV